MNLDVAACARRPLRRPLAASLAAALCVSGMPALAQDQTVELRSSGAYVSKALPADVTEVELLEQVQGRCRFNRTWGYDLTNRELWADGGCGGKFKLTRPEKAEDSSSNSKAAIAAVAAIAGIMLLSSHNRDREPAQPGPGPYPPPPPPPPPAPGGVIRGMGGLCLDVEGGQVRPGARLTTWKCHGRANQQFSWGRYGELMVGGLCVDIEGGNRADGARLITWPCAGSPNQRWRAWRNQITSQMHGKCVDMADGQAKPGQAIVMWTCHGRENQRWWW